MFCACVRGASRRLAAAARGAGRLGRGRGQELADERAGGLGAQLDEVAEERVAVLLEQAAARVRHLAGVVHDCEVAAERAPGRLFDAEVAMPREARL